MFAESQDDILLFV